MRVPNRVLQCRNPTQNFVQPRNPEGYFWHPTSQAYFQCRNSPRFYFKISHPELQIREVPNPKLQIREIPDPELLIREVPDPEKPLGVFDDHTQATYEMTPGFKFFVVLSELNLVGWPSSLRGSRKKGGGGGEVKKNAKGIGEDPSSPLPSSPPFRHLPLRAPRYRNAGLYPVLLFSH